MKMCGFVQDVGTGWTIARSTVIGKAATTIGWEGGRVEDIIRNNNDSRQKNPGGQVISWQYG